MSKFYLNFDRIYRNWNVTTQKHLNQITSGRNIWKSKLSLWRRVKQSREASLYTVHTLTVDETLSMRLHFIWLRFYILIWFWVRAGAEKGNIKPFEAHIMFVTGSFTFLVCSYCWWALCWYLPISSLCAYHTPFPVPSIYHPFKTDC